MNENDQVEQARAHLRQIPELAPLLNAYTPREREDYGGDVYFGLIRAITYQQLSGKAAGTIFGRFLDLFPDGYPHPEALLEMSEQDLRAVGMSRSKAAYLQNVARFWREYKLLRADWTAKSDEEILALLTQIKGVGHWTAEMVLMFVLHRPDVLPLDDLVVRRGVVRLLGLEELRGRKQIAAILEGTAGWRPHRSYASRLLWEAGG